ncbi:MAG: hypothetical protein ACKV2O_10340 [Acidimicrobiales bacterium]
MGLLSGLAKAGLAKKAVSELRRPENQAKARRLFSQLSNRRRGTNPVRTPPR